MFKYILYLNVIFRNLSQLNPIHPSSPALYVVIDMYYYRLEATHTNGKSRVTSGIVIAYENNGSGCYLSFLRAYITAHGVIP